MDSRLQVKIHSFMKVKAMRTLLQSWLFRCLMHGRAMSPMKKFIQFSKFIYRNMEQVKISMKEQQQHIY